MTSQLPTSQSRFETAVIAELMTQAGGRMMSADMYHKIITIVNDAINGGKLARHLVSYIRLAIKLSPYAPEIPSLLKLHDQVLKTLLQQKAPALFETIRMCREKNLPLPVIASCEKYLSKARTLQKEFTGRYFSIAPVIVRGDAALDEETYEAPVLSLPVADSYEALPVKILETCVLLHAADDKCGVIKIDDDLTLKPSAPDLAKAPALFAAADYMGVPVQNIFHDRLWHHGKCATPVPAVYGKPIKSIWARGALYYLSAQALGKLSHHYLRFPGALDGEMYEDKAVGDILYDNNIILAQYVLEHLLGLDSAIQDRS